MNKVVEIEVLFDKNLLLHFDDGELKIIDLQPFIGKGMGALLSDSEYFKKVTIDNGGGIEWPNGFDFCPNFLKELVPYSEVNNKVN